MSIDQELIAHYGGDQLLAAIEAGLASTGVGMGDVTVADLGPVDEFHIGGRPATMHLLDQLEVTAEVHVLDLGCGIGGTCRLIADTTGSRVTGIDLNPSFVDVARTLTSWTGLDDRISYECGSILELPFDDDTFDRAVQLHVGMNIADKATLFAEVARVLRPGGRLGVYDIVRVGEGDLSWPVPWASDSSQSFVADLETYRGSLAAAGFDVQVNDRRQFAIEFFAAQAARDGGPPPLGVHLIIGSDAPTKLANLRAAVDDGALAPVEFIAVRR